MTTELSPNGKLVLGHIRGRTLNGGFASRIYNMWESDWEEALDEIRSAGYALTWVNGTVADEPSITGGWVLASQTFTVKTTETVSGVYTVTAFSADEAEGFFVDPKTLQEAFDSEAVEQDDYNSFSIEVNDVA
jgi:hypothetical protein